MSQIVEFDGTEHEFPDDFSQQEIQQALSSLGKGVSPQVPQPTSTAREFAKDVIGTSPLEGVLPTGARLLLGANRILSPEAPEAISQRSQDQVQARKNIEALGPLEYQNRVADIHNRYDSALQNATWDDTGKTQARLEAARNAELQAIGIQPIDTTAPAQLPVMTDEERQTLLGGSRAAKLVQRGQQAVSGVASGFLTPEGAALFAPEAAVGSGLKFAYGKAFEAMMATDAAKSVGEAAGAYSAGDTEAGDKALIQGLSTAGLIIIPHVAGKVDAKIQAREILEKTFGKDGVQALRDTVKLGESYGRNADRYPAYRGFTQATPLFRGEQPYTPPGTGPLSETPLWQPTETSTTGEPENATKKGTVPQGNAPELPRTTPWQPVPANEAEVRSVNGEQADDGNRAAEGGQVQPQGQARTQQLLNLEDTPVPPVIRDVQPNSIPADAIVPAIRLIGGKVVPGKGTPDETHNDIIKDNGLTTKDIDQRGFSDPAGTKFFLDRETAAKGTGVQTQFEAGRLHSTDLQKQAEKSAEPLAAIEPSPESATGPKAESAASVPASAETSPVAATPPPIPENFRDVLSGLMDRYSVVARKKMLSVEQRAALSQALEAGRMGYVDELNTMLTDLEKSAPNKPRNIGFGLMGRKKFDYETQTQGYDILSWIAENMKLMSKSAARKQWGAAKFKQNASLYEDAPGELAAPHHNAIYGGNNTPDNVAKRAFEAGVLKTGDTERDLWPAIEAASKKRVAGVERDKREANWMAQMAQEKFNWDRATSKAEKGKFEVTNSQLAVGDVLEVEGEKIDVEKVDPDTGDITLQDGRRFGTQVLKDGQSIYVEKITEGEGKDDVDFGPTEETAPTKEDLKLAAEIKSDDPLTAAAIEGGAKVPEGFAAEVARNKARVKARTDERNQLLQRIGQTTFEAPATSLAESRQARVIISPNIPEPGTWRVTIVDKDGPSGHTVEPTWDKAVESAQRDYGADLSKARQSKSEKVETPKKKQSETQLQAFEVGDVLQRGDERVQIVSKKKGSVFLTTPGTGGEGYELSQSADTGGWEKVKGDTAPVQAEKPPAPAPKSPEPELPAEQAKAVAATAEKFGGTTPDGTKVDGYVKEKGRWYPIDEAGNRKPKALASNAKKHAQLEEAAKAPAAPPETRTPVQIINSAARVKVKLPEGATVLRATDAKGRKADVFIAKASGENQFQGADIVKLEAGIIDKNKQFKPVPGEVKVEEVKGFKYNNPEVKNPISSQEVIDAVRHQFGIEAGAEGSKVVITNDPNAPWGGRAHLAITPESTRDANGNFKKKISFIELNPAKIRSKAEAVWVLEHEFAHAAAEEVGGMIKQLTGDEFDKISGAIDRAGYPLDEMFSEASARSLHQLANEWRKRSWFGKAVGAVLRWANNLGFKLTRRAAESIAAKALARAIAEAKELSNGEPITKDQVFNSLARTADQFQKQRELEPQTVPEKRAAGAYADIARMKTEQADQLNLSPRSRRLLNLPVQQELASRGLSAMLDNTLDNYFKIRDSISKSNPNQRWGVIGDALEAHGREQTRAIKLRQAFAEQEAKVTSPAFQKKVNRLVTREIQSELAAQKAETFKNIVSVKAAQFLQQLERSRVADARTEALQSDLKSVQKLLNYQMAVAMEMDNIVRATYKEFTEFGRGGYWDPARVKPDVNKENNAREFLQLYLRARRQAGNPIRDTPGSASEPVTQMAIARLAAETLGANYDLTQRLMWAQKMSVEPDFAGAVSTFGKAFSERLEKEPQKAVQELMARGVSLGKREADTRNAFMALNKEVTRELEHYSDLEGAVSADARIQASPEWKNLINTVHSDAEALRIPDIILQNTKNRQVFNEFTGRISQLDPKGNTHDIDLNWTPINSAIAQQKIDGYLGAIRDWLYDPANANHPDTKYWQEQADFVDAVYNTAAVLSPGSVQSLVFKHSWTMPEFFFRQASIPAAKVAQTAFENWHRAWVTGDQWSRATEQPLIRALSKAAKKHGFDVSMGLQQYREAVLNPLAWEYRHGRTVKPGEKLFGVTINAEDLAALKQMGSSVNELFRKQKNLGAERVMQPARVFDQWAKDSFAIRMPQEFGAEVGTTVPREFSLAARTLATRIASLGDKFDAVTEVLNRPEYFETFVKRWFGQRSSDFSRSTPFESLFKEISQKWNSGAKDAPRTIEEVLDYIDQNTDGMYSRDQIQQEVVGNMAYELTKFYKNFVETKPGEISDIRVIRATRQGPGTEGFQRDVGSSFYYDFGMANAQEVRSLAIDSGMYHMMRFANSLGSLEQEYSRALQDLAETQGRPEARQKLMDKNRSLFRSGQDFRDYEQLQQQLSEVKYFRSKLPIFSGEDVATYESMRNAYRLIGDDVSMKLSGWKTFARVLTGSVVKQGFVFGAVERWYPIAYAKAGVSMAMSALRMGVVGPAVLAGRRLGLAKEFEGQLSGIAEELYRQGKWFDQQYSYGLGTKTPVYDTVRNNLMQPHTHGRGYDPRLSNNVVLRNMQKAAYRTLSVIEAPLEAVRTIFPGLGYAIAYDSVARQMYWAVRTLEAQARRSFEIQEKLGNLGSFDLNNPKSLKNKFLPEYVMPRGLTPSTSTRLNLVREMFHRGTDMDLQDATFQFWKKLSETPKKDRGNVRLLSADAATPDEAGKLERDRSGALASVGLFDIHHASPANRMWALRSGWTGRMVFPIIGWFTQSTRQIFALLGRAPSDPKLTSGQLTAMTALTILAATGVSTVMGDAEKRVFEKLSWILQKQVDPVRHLGQGRNAKEEAQIAASDATNYITILNSMFNAVLGEQSNRGQMGAQVFVTEEINSWLNYLNGVVHTKNPIYGLDALAAREFPLSKVILSRTPGEEGLQAQRNTRTLIQRFAPNELLRQEQGSFGMATPTELTPIKQKLANAIYRGDSAGVAEAYDEFRTKAAELGRSDPDRLSAEVMRSLNPYSMALVGHPTEEQRNQILNGLRPDERQLLLDAEQNYLAAAQSVGVQSDLVRKEPGSSTAGTGEGGNSPASASVSRVSGGAGRRISIGRGGAVRLPSASRAPGGSGRRVSFGRLPSTGTRYRVRASRPASRRSSRVKTVGARPARPRRIKAFA